MTVSNFQLIATTENNVGCKVYHAIVDIETGKWWWKKKKTEPVRKVAGSCWMFINSGRFAPDEGIRKLAVKWAVKTGEITE